MKNSGAELRQQAQATAAAAAGAQAGAAAARGALRGMRQSPGGRGARGVGPAGARGPALRLPHPARPAPCAALGPRRAPEERGRRFPGGGRACPRRRLPSERPPRGGSRVSGSPASASYMEDRGGRNRKAPGEAARASKEPRSPLLSNLIWGWGEAGNYKKKKKKQARDLFFSSISLVTGSPRIPCARRLGGGGRADFTPHEPSGETWRFSPNLRSKYAKAPDENHQLVRPQPGLGRRKCLQSGTRRLRGAEAHPRATCPLRSSQSLVGLPLRFFCLPPKNRVIFFFNPQKGRARLLQSCASGCPRGVSGLSSCAPGGPGSRRGLPRGWRGRRGRRCCRCGCGGGGDCAQRG